MAADVAETTQSNGLPGESAKQTAARKCQKTAILECVTDSWGLFDYGIGAPTISTLVRIRLPAARTGIRLPGRKW